MVRRQVFALGAFLWFVGNSSTILSSEEERCPSEESSLWDGLLAVQIHLFQLARFTDVTAPAANANGTRKAHFADSRASFLPLPPQMNFGLP